MTCARCRKSFQAQDRVKPIYIVTGIGPHPMRPGTKTVFLAELNEHIHHRCEDPSLVSFHPPQIIIPRTKIMTERNLAEIRPDTPDYVCRFCYKQYKRGDRIEMLYIVLGSSIDPDSGHPAVECSSEYETAHPFCNDPDLSIGPGPLVVS